MTKKKKQIRKGQALVEYTIILAAVMLISLGTISLLGHKTTDMLGTLTAMLPGAHTDDNGPIAAGEFVPTAPNTTHGAVDRRLPCRRERLDKPRLTRTCSATSPAPTRRCSRPTRFICCCVTPSPTATPCARRPETAANSTVPAPGKPGAGTFSAMQ